MEFMLSEKGRKAFPRFADEVDMTSVIPEPTTASATGSLIFGIEGIDLAPRVDLLADGQARFDASQHFDMFYEGQMIGPAVLSLEADNMAVIYPVVKSKNWPTIHVEFMGLSEKDRTMIDRFLAKSGGSRRPPSNKPPVTATFS